MGKLFIEGYQVGNVNIAVVLFEEYILAQLISEVMISMRYIMIEYDVTDLYMKLLPSWNSRMKFCN